MLRSVVINNIGPILSLEKNGLDELTAPTIIVGENRVGKTHIIDCVAYAIAGEFPSKPASVYNRVAHGENSGSVAIEFTHKGKLYKIERTLHVEQRKQKGHVWIDGELVAGPLISEINKFIQENIVDPDAFLVTNFSAQFGKGDFVNIAPSERKEILSNLIGLNLSEHLPFLQEKKREIDKRVDILKALIDSIRNFEDDEYYNEKTLKGIEESLLEHQKSLKAKQEEYRELRTREVELRKRLESSIANKKKIEYLQKAVNIWTTFERKFGMHPEDVEATSADINKKVNDGKAAIIELNGKIRNATASLERAKAVKEQAQKSVEEINKANLCATCPVLRNKQKHIDKVEASAKEQEQYEQLLAELQGKVSIIEVEISELSSRFYSLTSARDIIASYPELKNIDSAKQELESLRANDTEEDSIRLEIDKIAESMSEIQSSVTTENTIVAQVSAEKGKAIAVIEARKRREKEEKDAETELNEKLSKQKILEILVTGFGPKGIQPLILELSIPEICNTANELLESVCDGELRVDLKTIRETNQGKASKETLEINVTCPDGRSGDVIEFSGAEQAMIRTALRISMCLFNMRQNKGLDFIIFDEPFGSYDSNYNNRVMEMFVKLAQEVGQIFIVSHQPETYNHSGSIISLEKKGGAVEVTVV